MPDVGCRFRGALEGNVVEIFFVQVHVVAVATADTAGLYFALRVAVAWSAQELYVVGDDVDRAPLRAVLGLPGAILELALDQDRVALFGVVRHALSEVSPGGDVEEVDLFILRENP